ncbi:MAG: hypothetical protein J5J06_13350 [Phycisphaerae bacterium]|nr:hypothetical protein [Phycisphaerae bacterium]
MTFDTGETLGVTPNHELWTYEDGWIDAAHVQPGDHLDHACGMAVAVVDRVYDPSPTFVYDLTVDGTWTFFAGELWVHNSSCVPDMAAAKKSFFDSWIKNFTDPGQAVTDWALRDMVAAARRLGLTIRGPELGRSGVYQRIWHLHIGEWHIPCSPNFVP